MAELSNVTAVTISRLEQENNDPEPETVGALALALEFPYEFFFGDDVDELAPEAVSFRSLTSMSAIERDAALAAGSLAYLVCDWIEQRFNLPKPNLIDLSHERDAANAASVLRKVWGLGEKPIADMIRLLETKGIRVFSLAENTKNVDAFSCWRDGKPYIFLNTFKSAEHTRFDAAHELGHLVLHKHGGPQQGKLAEAEANSFASAFLMPAADVCSRVRHVSALSHLIQIKARWGVSLAAMTYRLHKLKVLSAWQYRTFYIQLNKMGYRVSEPEPMKREVSTVWKKVFSELWSQRITRSNIADELFVPQQEIENLFYGLMSDAESHVSDLDSRKIAMPLRLVAG